MNPTAMEPTRFGAAGEDAYKAAPLGLLVLILLGVACYALFRSMSKHLRNVQRNFPTPLVRSDLPSGRDFPVSPGFAISAVYDGPRADDTSTNDSSATSMPPRASAPHSGVDEASD